MIQGRTVCRPGAATQVLAWPPRTAATLALVATLTACTSRPADTDAPPADEYGAEVQIDTDSGTWINLDVRPDGKQIVFDLLGDIFVVPIDGGDAEPVLGGHAWDGLPRYSPDGSEIAFASDRSGTQNIWTVDVTTGALRQVTHEARHLPSSPAWTPDGRSIAVRRQFAAKRTVGAGEIWLYPAAGGTGEAIVRRHSTQKDINEPRFSDDGQFLYYSENLWPGDAFAYNKDPTKGIYGIRRWNADMGEVETVVQRAGGAIRPTPSPNGRLLAYVTRHGMKSALVIRDLDTGRERVLKQDLDRDLQAVWANHGVYPAFGWMPDGSAIVLWSGGHILRLDVANGRTRRIPFRVRQAYRINEPPRPTFRLPDDRYRVRAFRQTTVSPDGTRMAFQALGRIYLHDLTTGTTRPLAPDDGSFRFYPAFSPDSEWIVHTTWRDGAMGDLRRTHIETGETVVLTDDAGMYLEPTVDGGQTTVAFRRGAGGSLLRADDEARTGIHTVPWSGGGTRLITDNGTAPSFCDNGRLYFVRERAIRGLPPHDDQWLNHSRHLISRDLVTGEEVDHADAGLATELELSRDCSRLAWVRHSEVRAARFDPSAAGPVRLDDVEHRRASGDGGAYLGWSGDGTLHWSLGPTLYAWRPGEKGSEPAAVDLVLDTAVDKPPGPLALTGARLVTMGVAGIVEDGVIVLRGDRIVQVGSAADIAIPPNAAILEISGKTVVPGLIDSHWHGSYAVQGITPQANWTLRAGLAFGITTVFDPFAPTADVFAAAELTKAGGTLSPRILSTGTALYGADSDITARIDSLDDARKEIRRRMAFGAIAVKSYLLPGRDQQQRVIAAARESGVRVVAEQAMATPAIMAQVFDGHTSIEHNLPYEILYDDITQAWSATGVDHTPTLTVLLGGLWPSSYWLEQPSALPRDALLAHLPPAYLDEKRAQDGSPDIADHAFRAAAAQVAKLSDAGIRIVAGAHAEIIGLGYHWELWMLRDGGMTAGEVLRSATIDAARHLGLSADLGSIEPGKRADLVVLDGNPLQNIRETASIRYVVTGGRVLDAETLVAPRD